MPTRGAAASRFCPARTANSAAAVATLAPGPADRAHGPAAAETAASAHAATTRAARGAARATGSARAVPRGERDRHVAASAGVQDGERGAVPDDDPGGHSLDGDVERTRPRA